MTALGVRAAVILGVVVCATSAFAADLRVLSAAAAKGPLVETAAAFERETGHRVILEFTTAGRVDSRIAGGERADLVVSSRARLDAMVAKGVRTGVVRDLGIVHVGVAVRSGSRRPDTYSTRVRTWSKPRQRSTAACNMSRTWPRSRKHSPLY